MSIFPFLFAFILTFISTPYVAKLFFSKGIVGRDLHKEEDIKIPEMGGVTIFFALLVILVYSYFQGNDELLGPIFAIYIIGTLGMIDGLTKLSASQKVASFYVVGVFLAWSLGFRGIPSLLTLGFLFMASVNFTNMLAGFNGLEIGTGAIAAVGLSLIAFLEGAGPSFTITSAISGALLAFLYFNRYPAMVFPGDVGTLIIGSALFSSILLGGLYVQGLLIFIPYLVDASLKFLSVGIMTKESQEPTVVRDGKLYVPKGSNLSLARLFLMRGEMTEKAVVQRVWSVEAFFVALAIFYGALI
jgi:UDP-N-acetylglucosamine--dolichyl-phosphate N-acetylglucosaminephosphotransferase